MSSADTDSRTDEELAKDVCEASVPADAFHALYERHASGLLAYLASRVPRDELDDRHQEIWTKAWQSLTNKTFTGHFRGWLFTVARNTLIDRSRRKTMPTVSGTEEMVVDQQDPLHQLLDEERYRAFSECLGALSEIDNAIIRGRLEGSTYEEISVSAGIRVERAHRVFHDSKKQLTDCVGQKLA